MNERASVPSELGAVDDYKPSMSTSADDEAFVTELATSLIVLVATWRERVDHVRRDPTGMSTDEQISRCANELEAVLRSAT